MQALEGIKVLFVAGFGPIVRDKVAGRKLYGDTLNISFREEQGDICLLKRSKAPGPLHYGPSNTRRSPVLAKVPGRTTPLFRRHGWNSMWRTSSSRASNWIRGAIARS
jgi:hypothetical protein